MSGIYGICEPGVQLQPHELEPMSLATRLGAGPERTSDRWKWSIAGCSPSFECRLRLSAEHGLFVAVDADLCNYNALLAEYQRSNGDGISSVGRAGCALICAVWFEFC